SWVHPALRTFLRLPALAGVLNTIPSRTSLQLRIEIWFYAFLLSAVIPVVVASLALQAVISNTAPVDAASKLWGHP
ncbi:hypothetical protein, partial [Ralstonia pseudosolanacearum]